MYLRHNVLSKQLIPAPSGSQWTALVHSTCVMWSDFCSLSLSLSFFSATHKRAVNFWLRWRAWWEDDRRGDGQKGATIIKTWKAERRDQFSGSLLGQEVTSRGGAAKLSEAGFPDERGVGLRGPGRWQDWRRVLRGPRRGVPPTQKLRFLFLRI